ncbi:patatin-like phospholipase family protein [Candidatus Cetobacterium colombiensis]|uniref:Patatin family protein n=1 Tax=Candidatus Cetobacterium colombiensis TaxID=3073100 RepID=A0ABU4W7P0_9FUSO|nr:patatin family protein [Candidatus Cetobacterium colombiensis]MDX8335254.1 patatin family protein [Candidatus Cetobacterium colombiensis]
MDNVGLVLEGGGLRGIYTSGVLDYFLSKGLYFNYTIGVSAGAIYSASYASRQKRRNIDVVLKYINDERYMGYKYLVKKGSYINIDFAYKKMTYELSPFDFETFNQCNLEFKVGAFNCTRGKTDFFSKKDFKSVNDLLETLVASGSLPFFSKETYINEKAYLDGGIADPIPLSQSILDGNSKNVIILTEDEGYKKEPLKLQPLIKLYYRKYPKVADALLRRHLVYNRTLKDIKMLEEKGDVFVFRPSKVVVVDRLEKDLSKIKALYNLGIEDARQNYKRLVEWLNIEES